MRAVATACLLVALVAAGVSAKGRPGLPRELLQRLFDTMMMHDYKALGDLFSDNAEIRNVNEGCGYMTKTQFLQSVNASGIQHYLGSILEGQESHGHGTFRTQSAAIGTAESKWANYPWYDDHAYIHIIPSDEGEKIDVLERFTDQSWRQSNASDMVAAWTHFASGAQNQSITEMEAVMDKAFFYAEYEPKYNATPVYMNYSTFVADVSEDFKRREWTQIQTTTAFAACDFVVSSGYSFVAYKEDKTKQGEKSFRVATKSIWATHLNSAYKIDGLFNYELFPWPGGEHRHHK